MALYRHVANKSDLIEALLEEVSARVVVPPNDLRWREGLTALALAVRSEMLRHPGLVAPLLGRPTLGPNALAIGEYGYRVMAQANFSPTQIERGVNTILTYTIGFTALEVPRTQTLDGAAPPNLDTLEPAFDDLDPVHFPHTTQIRPQASEFVSAQQFHFGLKSILDGLEAQSITP